MDLRPVLEQLNSDAVKAPGVVDASDSICQLTEFRAGESVV